MLRDIVGRLPACGHPFGKSAKNAMFNFKMSCCALVFASFALGAVRWLKPAAEGEAPLAPRGIGTDLWRCLSRLLRRLGFERGPAPRHSKRRIPRVAENGAGVFVGYWLRRNDHNVAALQPALGL